MIPDKIWVNTDTLQGYHMSNHPPYGEEYIRKDTLLEWAKGTIAELENQNAIKDDICNDAMWELEEVIAKILSL